MLAMSAADIGDASLRQAEIKNLALAHEVADRSCDLLDRDVRIDPMLVEEVDPVGPEAAQRALDRRADRLRVGCLARRRACFPSSNLKPNLVAIVTRFALALQRAADQRLVSERPIDFGGVEERAAEVDGAMQSRDRFRFVRRPIGLAHAHAAETDRRDFQSLLAEVPLAEGHGPCSCRQSKGGEGLHGCSAQAKASIS